MIRAPNGPDFTSLHPGYSLMDLTDPNGSTSWSYDGHGRPTQRRQQLDGIQLTVNYGYDSQGRLIELTYPSGEAVTFGYDPAGGINRVQADGQTIVEQLRNLAITT